ncbi:MAG: threonine synthase [Syntrophobacterales bacterium]|jgi:threonine synthase|nr:threonine synthase [Syntrophobacterales bacterium]
MAIRYYSTNRNLSFVEGLKPFKETVTFREALLQGQAPDEGLFMPDTIPLLNLGGIASLKGKPYAETAKFVARAFLHGDVPSSVLSHIIEDAYNFPVPLEHVTQRKYILRLDQGPTSSFKDFAARMMARLMSALRDEGQNLHVLVATSGDTGSAVGDAFHNVSGIRVTILYPRHEVSGRQKKQLDSIGDNVQAISLDGKFDQCQDLVKEAFADPELAPLHLTSANSINFGRILPQMIYYVYAYAQLAAGGEEIVFSVPSGNFGNALGCEFARRMGLPVAKLVMPVNENEEFPRYLTEGVYQKISPSISCLSNAMNVGHPSNLARFFDLFGGTVDRTGHVHVYPDREEMKKHIFSVSVTDQETKDTINQVYRDYGVILEPHGAVAWRGLERYLAGNDDALCVCLETAHPAKFPEEVEELLRLTPELPPAMQDIDAKQGEALNLPASYDALKDYLLKTRQEE